MSGHCLSCMAPLASPEFAGKSEVYCRYCTDEEGRLRPREQVLEGIAGWLRQWQGPISEETARRRAVHFMRAMPAWADD